VRSTISGVVIVAALLIAGFLAWQGFHQPFSVTHDLALAACVAGLLIASVLNRRTAPRQAGQQVSKPKIRVESMYYENQPVRLDGCEFVDCCFSNVTFIYDGREPFAFVQPKFGGKITISTKNQQLLPLLDLLRQVEEKKLPVEVLVSET